MYSSWEGLFRELNQIWFIVTILISIWAITAPEPEKIGSFMNREGSSWNIWLYGNVCNHKPQVEIPQGTSHDHCSSVGHILKQKVVFMLSRAALCCCFFHGASTKCTFQLASSKSRSHPWAFPFAWGYCAGDGRQSPAWHWHCRAVPRSVLRAKGSARCAQECPQSQRLSQKCPAVLPNLPKKRTHLIKAIMEVALCNGLPWVRDKASFGGD